MDFGGQSGVEAPAQQALGRIADGAHTTEPIPDGFAGDEFTVAPDGALWVIGTTGARIIRGGYYRDQDYEAIRYDGTEVSTIALPFPGPADLAVHPNGTLWVASSPYGAFAYDGTDWVQYENLPDEQARLVEIGPDGSVYIGTRFGLTRSMPKSD